MSRRFEDDGIAEERLTATSKKTVRAVRRDLLNGSLERIPRQHCPLCHGEEAFLVACKDRLGLPVETLVCKKCGLVFSGEYFTEKSAEVYYGQYANQFKNTGRAASEMFKRRTRSNAYSWLRYKWLQDYFGEQFLEIGNVMEVGCNDGCNLYPFYLDGFSVFGCDYDYDRINAGKAEGLTLFLGGLEQLEGLQLKADLLIMSHVLEHVNDIDLFLRRTKRLLADDGKLYIEVPGLRYWNRPRRNGLRDDWGCSGNNFLLYLQLEHNFSFEWKTLRPFLLRNRLVLETGDEVIRSLFRKGDNGDGCDPNTANYGTDVYEYLYSVEKDRLQGDSLWRRIARDARRYFYN